MGYLLVYVVLGVIVAVPLLRLATAETDAIAIKQMKKAAAAMLLALVICGMIAVYSTLRAEGITVVSSG